MYGPQLDVDKLIFLQELRAIRRDSTGPWVVAGDFNLIYWAADKNNHNLDRAMMGQFRRLIDDLELKEVDLLGRRFTWSNKRASPTLVRLDRVFCTVQWEDLFPEQVLQCTAAGISDHCPLILSLNAKLGGRRRFHFEQFWPKMEEFLETVQHAWASIPINNFNCPLERLHAKLRATAKALQAWSQRSIGNVAAQLEQACELLHRLDMAQDRCNLSVEEDWLRRQLKHRCLALASIHHTIIRFWSRLDWRVEGDANTEFFHSHARYRKRKSTISKLVVEGNTLTSHEQMENAVLEYYHNLLGMAQYRAESLNLLTFHHVQHELHGLEAPISEDEVWKTIKDMPPDKVPGPDGFTGRFYKSCWQIIKLDVMAAIGAFHGGDAWKLHLLNSAYMVLIPKKKDPMTIGDYRPISLVHSFEKLLTKLLANRLAPHLGTLVAPNQSAFIRGRRIHSAGAAHHKILAHVKEAEPSTKT